MEMRFKRHLLHYSPGSQGTGVIFHDRSLEEFPPPKRRHCTLTCISRFQAKEESSFKCRDDDQRMKSCVCVEGEKKTKIIVRREKEKEKRQRLLYFHDGMQ